MTTQQEQIDAILVAERKRAAARRPHSRWPHWVISHDNRKVRIRLSEIHHAFRYYGAAVEAFRTEREGYNQMPSIYIAFGKRW